MKQHVFNKIQIAIDSMRTAGTIEIMNAHICARVKNGRSRYVSHRKIEFAPTERQFTSATGVVFLSRKYCIAVHGGKTSALVADEQGRRERLSCEAHVEVVPGILLREIMHLARYCGIVQYIPRDSDLVTVTVALPIVECWAADGTPVFRPYGEPASYVGVDVYRLETFLAPLAPPAWSAQ